MIGKVQSTAIVTFMLIGTALSYGQDKPAQNELLSYEAQDAYEKYKIGLSEALGRLEKKFDISFIYKTGLLDGIYVPPDEPSDNLAQELEELLGPANLTYSRLNNRSFAISVDLSRYTEPFTEIIQQQVSGRVFDEDSEEALPGVNITIKGSSTGTATDIDGNYSLQVPSLSDTLVFSYIGYQIQEIPVDGRSDIDVYLVPQTIMGSDVVVVGYGVQSTREITGSVQNISTEGLEDLPVAQLTQKLQGKLAGVNINQNTGIPGEGMNVRIRGAASITAGSEPLYVVDGMPITGDISDINPNEVESISVLKDASATSLYGSRAANGVVLIETRQARPGQTQVSFNSSYGVQKIPQRGRPDVMNAREYAQFQKEIDEFNGRPVDPEFQNPEQYGEGTDWYDEVTQVAPIQDYSLALSTGTETFSTTATVGYLNQQGVVIETGYERYSLRVNTDFQPIEGLNFRFNVAPNVTLNTNSNTNGAPWTNAILSGALLSTPLAPARNPDGTLPLTAQDPATFGNPNFLRTAKERVNDDKSSQILSNAIVEYEILDGLRLKTSGNVDFGKDRFFTFNPSTTGALFNPPPIIPNSTLLEREYTSWVNENTLTYQQNFGDHSFDALAGFTAQKYSMDATDITASNYPDDKVQPVSAAGQITLVSDVQEWTLLSYLARLNYNYKDRYLISASVRRDGSSRFGENNRWGNFPSFSVGWILTEEPFMPESELISFLKLRGSYGVVGNFNIGNYTHISTISSANYGFGNGLSSGRSVDNLGDNSLGWETNKEYNVGLDLYLWNDRIQFSYDYYNKRTEDLLYNVEVPLASGFSNIQTNIGELKFWGHEFSVRTFNVDKSNLSWNTDFNLSFDRNEVVALGTENAALFSGGGQRAITQVGSPIGMFYGMIHEGVYDNQQEFDNSAKHTTSHIGTVKFRDVNGDGVITQEGDQTVMGNPWPEFTFGMTNTVQYRNFDFSLTLNASYGNDIIRLEEQYLTNLDGVFNVYSELKNRWRSPENPGDGKFGSVRAGSTFLERDWWNSRFIYDGSYLSIRNITVGYSLPVDNVGFLSRLRIYGSVQNAHIFTSYPGANPEVNTTADAAGDTQLGVDQTSYPVPRTISFGVNLNF